MRNVLMLLLALAISFCSHAKDNKYMFSFFTNSPMPGHYFYSKVENIKGSFLKSHWGKIPVSEEIFHTAGNSLKLEYTCTPGGYWEADLVSQGKRGMDEFVTPANLVFWIRADGNIPAEAMPQVKLRRNDESYSEAYLIHPCTTDAWEQVIIPLDSFGMASFDPLQLKSVVFSSQENMTAGTYILYIDDVELLPEEGKDEVLPVPNLLSASGYARHIDLVWEKIESPSLHLVNIYRSSDAKNFVPIGIQQPYMNRYTDNTGVEGQTYFYRIACLDQNYDESGLSASVKASTRSMNDDELMTMVQEASFRYYWEGAETVSGMARENIPGRMDMIATGASGFGIMAILVGAERGFITREAAVERFLQILAFLEKADRFHGVYGHFMDGPSGKVEPFFGNRDNGADLVETSFLLQGLLVARQYFSGKDEKEQIIREKITRIWEEAEFDWFRRDPDSQFLYWHWSPDQGWVINHPLIGWNETMIVYILAIASPTHGVPPEMYYSGFASQEEKGQQYRKNWGGSAEGAMYTNGNSYYGIKLNVGVNNGGPLFFTHYSYMGCDPHALTDRYTNYFENNRAIALINYRYCVDNPNHFKGYGQDAWGLTASDGPYDYSADEPVIARDQGKLTPAGAIASFPYTPEESMKALKNYYYSYGHFLWGEYGFKDAFNLSENWCSEIYMGLNQAPMTVMIENYRSGLIWKLFMQDPDVQTGFRKLNEQTSQGN